MGYTILGSRPDPTLEFDVTDAATGAPTRVTILSGVVALNFERSGMRVIKKGGRTPDPSEAVSFPVPGLQPLPPGPDPVVVVELSLQQVGGYFSDLDASRLHGVGDVQMRIVPDQQQPTWRWIYVAFMAIGNEPMVLRYRVTVYRPRP